MHEQPSLDGMPPPLPDQAPMFAVVGLLQEDPRVYTTPAGEWRVQCLVRQHLQAHPDAASVLAEYVYPNQGCSNTTAQAAHLKARRMADAREVVLMGRGLMPTTHHGHRVLRIVEVTSVAPAAPLPPTTHGGF